MKNVTPAAGQVWEYKEYKVKLTKVTHTTIEHESEKNGYKYVDSMDYFLSSFKFIPQNDLEWLAVKVESLGSNIKFIARRGSEYLIFETKPEHTPGLYTRQEHQNMRYELGLDEKPKRKVYFGPSDRQHYDIARCYDDAVKLAEKQFMAHNKKETTMLDLSTTKGGDAAKAFRELGKVIDNLNKQKETKMIDLTIGSTVIVDGGRDRWSDADHLVDVPVQIMAIFDGLGLDDGKSIPMVAVSDKTGSSCCFRADMCKPAKTDEEKAVGAMLVEMSTKMQLRGDHDDYMVNDDTQVGVEFVIEYMAANGFKWVGE